jgi:toxin YoeB
MYKPDFSKKFKQGYDRFLNSSLYTVEKIDELVADTLEHPTYGLGQPERLRHLGGNKWSRHIDKKNRLVYEIIGGVILFTQCRGHYNDH